MSQGANDIAAYFTKVKGLWEELDDLDQILDILIILLKRCSKENKIKNDCNS